MMRLYGTLTSPYVRKVRVVLAEKMLDYQFVEEDITSPNPRIQEVNPLGKVPCLVMDDGYALYDSRVIVEYLDAMSPVGKLIPMNGRERVEVKCWEALADGVMDAAILARLEGKRPKKQQSEEWTQHQMGKVDACLLAMSNDLADKPFCNGKNYSLADAAVGCALGWLGFRYPEINWKEFYPNLANLFKKLSERPSFKETIPVE